MFVSAVDCTFLKDTGHICLVHLCVPLLLLPHQDGVRKTLGEVLLLLLLSRFSYVRLCATPQMAAHQAPRGTDFPKCILTILLPGSY